MQLTLWEKVKGASLNFYMAAPSPGFAINPGLYVSLRGDR